MSIATEIVDCNPEFDTKEETKRHHAKPRTLPVRPENIPAELKALRQWVCWRWACKEGQWTKLPLDAGRPGRAAESDNPRTWNTWDVAWDFCRNPNRKVDGVGFMFAGTDLTGCDWDECRFSDGSQRQDVVDEVIRFKSYYELSPTAGGYHVLCRVPPETVAPYKRKNGKYEAYQSGRFFCLTGWGEGSIQDAPEAFRAFAERRLGGRPVRREKPTPERKPHEAAEAGYQMTEADLKILERYFLADGLARRLWDGDLSDDEGDQSKAVQALLGKVAFYFGDRAFPFVDWLFRKSDLFSGKWSEGKWARRGEEEWEAALAWQTERFAAREPVPEQPPGGRKRRGFRLAELEALPSPRWLVKQHYATQSLVLTYGAPGVGKTFLNLDQALCIASGKPYLDIYPVRKGPVVYISGEGNAGIVARIRAWMRHYGQPYPEDLVIVPFAFDLPTAKELDAVMGITEHDLGKMPVQINIDTVARNYGPGDENSTKDMGAFVRACDWLRERTGATIHGTHHSGKDPARKDRGSTALRGACDTIIAVEESQGGGILTYCDKQKDAEPFGEYILAKNVVHVGTNEDGDDITSCVYTPQDAALTRFQLLPRLKKDRLGWLWLNFRLRPFGLKDLRDKLDGNKGTLSRDLSELHTARALLRVDGGAYLIPADLEPVLNRHTQELAADENLWWAKR